MTHIPEHIMEEMRALIREGMPADEIAFMMRLNRPIVEAEMERINTTRTRADATR